MNRESCRKKNNLWDWDEVALYCICVTCVFILGVIVYLCCVCGKVSIMADNSKKDVDESGIVADEDSDNSVNDQTQDLGNKMLMKFIKEMNKELKEESDRKFEKLIEQGAEAKKESDRKFEELDRKANERAEESDRKAKELKEELKEELDSKAKERGEALSRKFEELKTQVESQATKCTEQTEKIEEAVTSLKNEVEAENKRFHEKLEKNEETVKEISETVRHFKGKTEYDIGEINSKVNGIKEELNNRETERDEKLKNEMDSINRKFQGQDNRFQANKESMEENYNKIAGEVNGIKDKVDQIGSNLNEMNRAVEQIGNKSNGIQSNETKVNAETVNKIKEEWAEEVMNKMKNEQENLIKEKVDQCVEVLKNNTGNAQGNHSQLEGKERGGLGFYYPPPKDLYFSGHLDENPKLFLKEVENYMDLTQAVPNCTKVKFIQGLLKGSAANWLAALSPFPDKYGDFKARFLERYWSEQVQYTFERRVLDGRWNSQSGQSYQDYALERISLMRLCNSEISDSKLIFLLKGHYPYYVQNLLSSAECRNLEKFQELLASYDRTKGSGNYGFNRDRQNEGHGNQRQGDPRQSWQRNGNQQRESMDNRSEHGRSDDGNEYRERDK